MFARATNMQVLKQKARELGVLGNGMFMIPNPKDMDELSLAINDNSKIAFLCETYTKFSQKDYCQMLREAWELSEFPHQHPIEILRFLFLISKRDFIMNDKEKEIFDKLPDTITIYRGTQDGKSPKKGLSWTVNKDVALWFRDRWNRDGKGVSGKLYEAKIDKRHVFAYLKERQEEEIIADPERLQNFKEVER